MRGGLKSALVLCCVMLLTGSMLAASAWSEGLRSNYQLGPGDKIQISVHGEPDLSMEAQVAPDGKISYTFIGDIQVAGLSIQDLEKRLYRILVDGYLKKPLVSVAILNYRTLFINGEVNSSGGYPYRPGLTVRKVVALAGGFSDRADEKRMTVIRSGDKSHKEQPIGLDDQVYPDDIITVPEGFW
ncbi:polysaccharide export protein [Magnetococcus marinus MC-1]|uniref:Polysaccharide export protein n=1 Tax=Magnetococcus marinus (strain ATCC BAA-1437 / JCM 17883 / MC-1) TaxID=156889 RepID=A0L5T6_MAGMM|nr:polysaccharide biosynthesis/export family protein [Magnetococcus marinus]ABK43329.1 polysaccharide export protein [Magnetococcus marinus MC-1]